MTNLKLEQHVWVILPASGIGTRMQASKPKQYLPFQNKTVIEATLDRLLSFNAVEGAVVVLNKDDEYWKALDYQHEKPVLTTIGAKERSGSVLNGLKLLMEQAELNDLWVMIHDAVRPCVTHSDLDKLLHASLSEREGLFLAHPVTDTLKKSDSDQRCLKTVNRDDLWRAFTPQMFPFKLIFKALTDVLMEGIDVTDDVSAVESLGFSPKIILGQSDNIKITYPQDILIANIIIENQNKD